MNRKTRISLFLLICLGGLAQFGNAQIVSKSFDFGISGFYNTSPVSITRGGNGIGGFSRQLQANGALGFFIFDNSVVGLRLRSHYDYFEVEGQFFNSNTGQYEPYIQIEQAQTYGAYGRYYSDFSDYIAAFAHVELGIGSSLLSVTEENAQGEIEQNDYTRDLEDFAISLGLAIRPAPLIGIEIMALRRTQFESYIPPGSTANIPQVETYQGFEFRIGLRLNLHFGELRRKLSQDKMPIGPKF